MEKLPFLSTLIINLEGPVIGESSNGFLPAKKAGPVLHNSGLPCSAKRSIFVLANNHFMDYGETGFRESVSRIEDVNGYYVGAGMTKSCAQAPLIFDHENLKIGVLARCEMQFGIATETKPGAAGLDSTLFKQIAQLKDETDVVVVSVHAAAEMLPWPSPRRQENWRALIDAGADIVHGHHAHVPQGWEEYHGGLIFYGLGNFCVDPAKWAWHPNGLWSLAPELKIEQGRIVMSPETTIVEDHGERIAIRTSKREEHRKHHQYLAECIRPLYDRRLLEGIWQEASIRMYNDYYADWLGFDGSVRKMLYRSVRGAVVKMKSKLEGKNGNCTVLTADQRRDLLRYHLFSCDSHNDAIATALGVLGGELEDLRTMETTQLVNRWFVKR